MKRFVFVFTLLLFAGFSLLYGQGVEITGTVTSAEDGAALPGVSVVVQGTTIGAVTDFEGTYSIVVPEQSVSLMFSFVGMVTQETAIDGRTTIDVVLESDVVGLDEVVVTAIGIERQAKALGYSVTEVENEKIANANTTDLVNAINGKVAGVRIQNSSGAAGASSYITIRGAASITGNNQPLFIVDGVPILSGGGGGGVGGVALSKRTIDLNPDDIASISVLKGGAATALYGVRAANGAILVTTKRGQPSSGNRVNVNVHSSVTMSRISQMPDLNDVYGQGAFGSWSEGSSLSWGPKLDTMYYYRPPEWQDQTYQWNPDGWLAGQNQADIDPAYLTNERANIYDRFEFFQPGIAYNNSVNVSGGNNITTYYLSMANLNEKGVVPNNTFDRSNVSLKMDTRLSDKIRTGVSVSYAKSEGNRIQQGSNISGVMLGLLRTPPSFNNAAGYKFPDGTQRNYRGSGTRPGAYDNPYWTANENLYNDVVDRFTGNWNLSIDFTDWFDLSYRVGTDFYSSQVKNLFAIGSRNVPDGRVTETHSFTQNMNSDLLLNFRKEFGQAIKARLTLGNNLYQYTSRGTWGQANGLEIPNFYQVSNTATQTTGNYTSEYRTAAVFGELSLEIMDMLFINATGRNDWSTTMPEENISDFYPSISGGFVFSELPFLKGNTILPFGKVRASYAITANIAGAYNTLTYFHKTGVGDGWTDGLAFPLMGYTGFSLNGGLGNSDLRHEHMASFEVGVDLRFVQNRIGLDFGYFSNENTDLLLSVPIASSSGYSSLYQNAASMTSKGVEIMLNLVPVRTRNFTWDITGNFTKFDNVVEELAPGVENVFLGGFTDPQIRAVAGQEYPTIYGYDYWRDDQGSLVLNDDPDDAYPDGFPMGNYVLVPIGPVNPDWTMAFTNTITFYGITLSALLEIKQGGLMWNGTRGALRYFGAHADTETRDDTDFVWDGVNGHLAVDEDGNEYVVSDGSANTTEVQKDIYWYALGEGSGFTGPTMEIEETSWVRLRELMVSYQLPEKILNNIFIKNVEVYFMGRNLFLSTPYKGIDPETNMQGSSNSQGMDYFNMPGTKSYSFGVKIGF